jgi:hypothetical protein
MGEKVYKIGSWSNKIEEEKEERKRVSNLEVVIEGLPSCVRVKEVGKRRIGFKEFEHVVVVK